MTELEKLLEQRLEINRKIKALQDNVENFGTVRMSKETGRNGYYKVQTLVKTLTPQTYGRKEEMWMATIRERTKEEVAHRIRVIITDMSELLKSLEQ